MIVHLNFPSACSFYLFMLFAEFDKYFLELNLLHTATDPWFSEYWEAVFGCTFDNIPGKKMCSGKMDIVKVKRYK